MSESGRIVRRATEHRDEASPVAPSSDTVARPLLDDVDELLDEIDLVLETNAEEFVRGYVQKGGE